MRIRKRPLAATSSGNPELHESSNGGLHLHAGSKSNPSCQDPRSFLLSPASIIMQDHFLLAGSGYGGTHTLSQKQLPAEAVSLMRKPYIFVSSGVELSEDGAGLMMENGGENPRSKSVMDVQHHEVKHNMHMYDGDDNVKGMDMKGCKELGLLAGSSGEGDKLAEACKKARHDIACKGSALHEEINVHADPAMVDYPRKVRPLQLILSSDYSPTPPKLPLPLCPTSSSSTLSCTTPPPPHKFDRASTCVAMKTPPLSSPAAGSLIKQIAGVKLRDEMRLLMRHEEGASSRCSQNKSVEHRAEFEFLQNKSDGPVSSWQGNRRPRSHMQGGRGFKLGAPGVNGVVLKTENTQKNNKKPKHPKVDSPCIFLQAPTIASPASAARNGEVRITQDSCAAPKNKARMKKTKIDPLGLLSPLTACELPISTEMIGSSLKAKRARPTAALRFEQHHVASVAPAPGAAASDHGLELDSDSMRCRRKDGRRWRCKEQVVKVGAPFCHYHTIKMREKHAASVARKLLKQLQGEVQSSLSNADFSRSSNKRRKIRSSPSSIGVHGDEEEENEQEMHAKLVKQQVQESLALRRRWRKKCKPCIRRLHDIHDRARPAATDGLDLFNPCAEDTYKGSSLVRSRSPLPECLLNTDPYEWRSDFP